MARPKARDLKTFVRLTLAVRLAAVGLLLAALLGVVEYFLERHRISEEHVEMVVSAAAAFSARNAHLIDWELSDHAGLQQALESFLLDPNRPHVDRWSFVLLRLYDLDGSKIVEVAKDDYPFMSAVQEALPHEPGALPLEETPFFGIVRVGKRPHIHSHVDFVDSNYRLVGRLVGVVALSDEALRQLRSHAYKESLYAILIVLSTTLLLYPVIVHLMYRLCDYAVSLLEANLDTQEVLGTAIALRDSETSRHNYRVTIMSVRLAEALGIDGSTVRSLIKGSFLHDVGKIGIPDTVLLKPGKLDEAEFDLMKRHVAYGEGVVGRSGWLGDARDVVVYHHEKVDGSGYLAGLRGGEIPLGARIFTIVDVFDALTSDRPYKDAFSAEKALTIMKEERGSRFDPALLDAFLDIADDLHDRLRSADVSYADEIGKIIGTYFFEGVDDIEY